MPSDLVLSIHSASFAPWTNFLQLAITWSVNQSSSIGHQMPREPIFFNSPPHAPWTNSVQLGTTCSVNQLSTAGYYIFREPACYSWLPHSSWISSNHIPRESAVFSWSPDAPRVSSLQPVTTCPLLLNSSAMLVYHQVDELVLQAEFPLPEYCAQPRQEMMPECCWCVLPLEWWRKESTRSISGVIMWYSVVTISLPTISTSLGIAFYLFTARFNYWDIFS